MNLPDCELCGDTGYITVIEPFALDDDDAGEVERPCPEGCLTPEEVPY